MKVCMPKVYPTRCGFQPLPRHMDLKDRIQPARFKACARGGTLGTTLWTETGMCGGERDAESLTNRDVDGVSCRLR